jgi:hypothetical protein
MAHSNKSPPPSTNADIVGVPTGGAPEPIVSATPLPPTDPSLAAPSATAIEPTASPPPGIPSAPITTADGFPNINLAPKQPQSKLLTPEERAKLIEELNALAGRPGAAQ